MISKILIYLTIVQGGMSENDIQEPIRIANTILKQVHIKLRVVSVNEIPDSYQDNTLKSFVFRHFYFADLLPPIPLKAINLISEPVTREAPTDSAYYLGGIASGICLYPSQDATASVFLALSNYEGYNRTYHSGVAIAHEIGHLIGASHDNSSFSVMDTSVLGVLGNNPTFKVKFKSKAKQEIRRCLNR